MPPEARSSLAFWPGRLFLATHILAILLISMTICRRAFRDGNTRHSGLFVNPNNLSLIPFLLLFFIDSLKDKRFIRVAAHGVVVTVLAYFGTSCAVLAYGIGLAVHFLGTVSKRSRSVYGLAAVATMTGVALLAAAAARLLPETRLTIKYQ
jgi:hypothetical protein